MLKIEISIQYQKGFCKWSVLYGYRSPPEKNHFNIRHHVSKCSTKGGGGSKNVQKTAPLLMHRDKPYSWFLISKKNSLTLSSRTGSIMNMHYCASIKKCISNIDLQSQQRGQGRMWPYF